jgi:hypothetical protein
MTRARTGHAAAPGWRGVFAMSGLCSRLSELCRCSPVPSWPFVREQVSRDGGEEKQPCKVDISTTFALHSDCKRALTLLPLQLFEPVVSIHTVCTSSHNIAYSR